MKRFSCSLLCTLVVSSMCAQSGFNTVTDLAPLNIVSNTAESHQSKTWTNAGKHWAVLTNSSSGTSIYRLDGTTWTNTFTLASGTFNKVDVKAVGNVTHIFFWKNTASYLYSVEYDPGTNNYKFWTLRKNKSDVTLESGVKSATIDIDGNGRMWLASDGSSTVNVRWSDSPYSTWSSAITLATGTTTTDMCAVVALPTIDKIGVFWSNKNTNRFGFMTHSDGGLPTTWSSDEAPGAASAQNIGAGFADHQFNIKATQNGIMYSAIKTNYNSAGVPQIALMVRTPGGAWSTPYTVTENEGTHPIVIVNETLNKLKVIYSLASGSVYYKESPLSTIGFGQPFILINGLYTFASSAKAPYNPDALIIASSGTNAASVVGLDVSTPVDNIPPTLLSINRQSPSTNPTNASSVSFRVTFSEAVTGVDATDFTLTTSGTAAGTISTVDAISATVYDINISAVAGNGTLRVDLNNTGTGITDAAGNAIGGGFTTGQAFTIQQAIPTLTTVSIASNNANTSLAKTGDLVTLSFTASEPINPPTVTIATHAVTATAGAGNSFTASYTMIASDATGTIPFSINFSSTAGSAGAEVTTTTNASTVSFDNTLPAVVSINRQSPAGNPTNATSVSFRATFSEAVTGVDAADFALTATASATGTISTITVISSTVYDVNVTAVAGNGTLRVDLNNSGTGIMDDAGNAISGGFNTGQAFTIQQAIPTLTTVSIASNNANTSLAKTGDLVTLSFTASEPINPPTVTIATHPVTATAGAGNSFTASYTMIATDATGTIPFSINFSSTAGSAGAEVTTTTNASTVSFDNTLPAVVSINRQSPAGNPTNATSVSFRATFSEAVTGVDAADFALTATASATGTISTITVISSTVYDVNVTAVAGNGTLRVDLNNSGTGIMDDAGNAISGGFNTGQAFTIQQIPTLTTVSIASNNANTSLAKTADLVTLSFTASEPINPPTVTIATHPVTATAGAGNSFTASYTMIATDATGTIPFSINFSSIAGSAGAEVTTTTNASSVSFDNTLPAVVSINRQSPATNPTNATSVTFRATFSEALTGVDASDFTPVLTATATGNISAVTAISSTVYDVNVTAVAGNGTIRLDLNNTGTGIMDAAGNAISGGFTTGETYTIQQGLPPTLTSVSIASNNANTSLAKTGDLVSLSFTASEPINTPTVTIATHPVTATAGAGNSFTASYTIIATDATGTIPFSINFSSTAGSAGAEVTTTTNASSVSFDNSLPAVLAINRQSPASNPTNATSVSFRVTFSEAVTGVNTSDFTPVLTATATGNISAVTVISTTVYDVTLTSVGGNGTVRLDLNNSGTGITDAAGNAISGGFTTGETYTIQQITGPGFSSITSLSPVDLSKVTKHKPQAKAWYYADQWWCVLSAVGGTKIFRLDGTTWTAVLTLTTRTSDPDCWVAGNLVHILGNKKDAFMYTIEFDAGLNRYKPWTVNPNSLDISLPAGTEISTIVRDGTGRLWIASDGTTTIQAWWSDSPYTSWSSPVTIATGVKDDDVCSLTALPTQGKIGVFWSNQNTQRFGFKTHTDGASPGSWSADEIPASQSALNIGNGMADDHMNIKVASDGTLYCVAKTSYDRNNYPEIILLLRRPNGIWDDAYTVLMRPEPGTQPTLILNEVQNKIRVLFTTVINGGNIAYRESSTAAISFGATLPLITSSTALYNYTTSTHHPYNPEVVIITTEVNAIPIRAVSILASDAPGLRSISSITTTEALNPPNDYFNNNDVKNDDVNNNSNLVTTIFAYPNPFKSNTNLSFRLKKSGYYTILVYDSYGRELFTLEKGWAEAGQEYTRNYNTSYLPKGLSIVGIKTREDNATIKVVKH